MRARTILLLVHLFAITMMAYPLVAGEGSIADIVKSKDGLVYDETTGYPRYVLAEAILSPNAEDLPAALENRLTGWESFLSFIVAPPTKVRAPTLLELREEVSESEAYGDLSEERKEEFAQLMKRRFDEAAKDPITLPYFDYPPGCDLTSRFSASNHSPDTWEETKRVLVKSRILAVVRVSRSVPAFLASVPSAPKHLIRATIEEILKPGDFSLLPGDEIVFSRGGGPVEVLGVRYCRWPDALNANFEHGDLALVAAYGKCDLAGRFWCDNYAYPIIEGAVHPLRSNHFEPVPLALVRSFVTSSGSE